jgi:uncharacterized protein with HEPN domain
MRRDDERLCDILEHIDSAVLAIASKRRPEFDIDPVLQKAVQYDLFIIGEAAANIPGICEQSTLRFPGRTSADSGQNLLTTIFR